MRNRGFASKALAYFRDGRVSTWRKMSGLLALAYVVMPIDLIPDLIPVVGWLDDLGVVSAATWFFTRELKRYDPDLPPEKEINPR